jgi:hypothetical protein
MIQIGFTRTNTLLSNIIRLGTSGVYSHAFISYYDPIIGDNMCMEAQWDGFHLKKLSKATVNDTKVEILTPKHSIKELPKVCANYLGDPYDYPGIMGAVPVMLARFFKIKLKNVTEDAKAKFCSEAITLGLQEIKYPGAEKLIANQTTPQDLYNFFKNEQA